MKRIEWTTVAVVGLLLGSVVALAIFGSGPVTIAAASALGIVVAGLMRALVKPRDDDDDDRGPRPGAGGGPAPSAPWTTPKGRDVPRAAILGSVLCIALSCKAPSSPTVDADASSVVEAGVEVATGICALIQGIDDNGTIRSICATVQEVAEIIAFVLTLRTADAGPRAAPCDPLPGTTFCATSPERAKAVLYVVRVRAARFMLDGGAQ